MHSRIHALHTRARTDRHRHEHVLTTQGTQVCSHGLQLGRRSIHTRSCGRISDERLSFYHGILFG